MIARPRCVLALALLFQQNISAFLFLQYSLRGKEGRQNRGSESAATQPMGGRVQKPLLSLEETPFIVNRWKGEIGGGRRLLRAALMLACLFAFCFLDPQPRRWDRQLWKKHNRMAGSSLQTGRHDVSNRSRWHQLKAKQG